eukprot:Tbor_TRINITY_DN5598_c3_g1::TRINITY_DN5598_c3_g1_i2::g.12527::m.12527
MLFALRSLHSHIVPSCQKDLFLLKLTKKRGKKVVLFVYCRSVVVTVVNNSSVLDRHFSRETNEGNNNNNQFVNAVNNWVRLSLSSDFRTSSQITDDTYCSYVYFFSRITSSYMSRALLM